VRRRYRVTTDSNHSAPIAPNRLRNAFRATLSDPKWCADLPLIPVEGGFITLAALLDIPTRLVVDWSLADPMEVSLVGDALRQALAWRRPAPGLIHHSDRGSQYASTGVRCRRTVPHTSRVFPRRQVPEQCAHLLRNTRPRSMIAFISCWAMPLTRTA
jgi:transposase InsO family protein